MKSRTLVAVTMLFCLSQSLYAQEAVEATSVFSDYLNVGSTGGFLYVPGLDFNSSMGFSYMSNDGYGSAGMGYYMGHFSLKLRPSLTLRWDVGIRSMLAGQEIDQKPQLFLPNIDLIYRPSDKLFFRIQYSQYPYTTSYRYWR
jgi:hypothetical protein